MNYVVLVLTIILVISLTLNKSLYDERNTLNNTLAIEESNNLHLTESIDKQNKTTLELKVDYDKRLADYYAKLNKQEKLLKGKSSNECEDIKRSLDDVLKLNL